MKRAAAMICAGLLLAWWAAVAQSRPPLPATGQRETPRHLALDWYVESPLSQGSLYREIGVSPCGRYLYVADLGMDAVLVFSADNPVTPLESFTHPTWAKTSVYPYALDVDSDGLVYVSCFDVLEDGINDNALWRWDPRTKTLQYLCALPQPVRGIHVTGEGPLTVVSASGNGWPPAETGIVIQCRPVTRDAFTAEVLFSTGIYRNQQDVVAGLDGRAFHVSMWDHQRREWLPDGPLWNPYESPVTLWDFLGNRDGQFSVSYFPRGNVPAMMYNPSMNRLYCLHLGIEGNPGTPTVPHDATLYKINPRTGKLIDKIIVGPSGTSGGGGIDVGKDGSIYLAWTLGGGVSALAKVTDPTFLARDGADLPSPGQAGGTGEDFPGGLPDQLALRQNYPNPFNPSTTITFDLPTAAMVRLSVIDMLGQEVAVLVDGMREAGIYSEVFDASELASGMYLCRLKAGSVVQSRKILLTR
jgi:DNA-binding beta-propeller fold protein YncE